MHLTRIILIYITSYITYVFCGCDRQYVILPNPATRFQAHQLCKNQGATLPSIESQSESDKLLDKLKESGKKDTYYWVGGLSYWKEMSSKWWFDNNARDMKFNGWCTDVGQPQEKAKSFTYQEPCVAANFKGDSICWHDYPCFATHSVICATTCDSDITKPFVQYGEFCVQLDLQTRAQAQDRCKEVSRDKTLINLDTSQKLDKLAYHYNAYSQKGRTIWIGLRRQAKDSAVFLWNNGQGPTANWFQWSKGYPIDTNFDCVHALYINLTFYFKDVLCDPNLKYYYVCE